MEPSERTRTVSNVERMLADLRLRGIHIWAEDGNVRYRALKGSLKADEMQLLRDSKDQIIAMLEPSPRAPTDNGLQGKVSRTDRTPLGFSQLWHWNLFRLATRKSARHVVSAMRIRGPLNVDHIRASCAELVRRHDSLRTQIVIVDGVPVQEVNESTDFELEVIGLTAVPEANRERALMLQIESAILQPIDLASDPLFSFKLLQLADDEHVLIVNLDHLISDGYSMNILLRDLFTAYGQLSRGRVIVLPEIAVTFAEYSRWQWASVESWRQQHGRYWEERLAGYTPVRAPRDVQSSTEAPPGWGSVPVQISAELRKDLRDWSRAKRTTLAMSVFTAYAALILRWCNSSDLVIQFQINSRTGPAVENTIGYFTSVLFLRIELGDDDSFTDLLNTMVREYCQAQEHVDANYLAAQMPRPAFAYGNWFNWIPLEPKLDVQDWAQAEGALTFNQLHFANPAVRTFDWDNDPEFVLFDTEQEVLGTVYFPLSRFSVLSMGALVRNFQAVIAALLTDPEQRVKEILLPE